MNAKSNLQLVQAVAGACGTSNDDEADRTECSTELIDLQQRNDTLNTHLSELRAQLETEQSTRCQTELTLLEKQQTMVDMECERSRRLTPATEELRRDLEHRHTHEMEAQLELIGMLKLQVHGVVVHGEPDRSVGRINNDPPPSSNSDHGGLDMHERVATSGTAQHERESRHSTALYSPRTECVYSTHPPPGNSGQAPRTTYLPPATPVANLVTNKATAL